MTSEHDRARAWREAHNLTQDQLAALTGYAQPTISWFEKGMTPPMRNAKGGNAADRRIKKWVWLRFKLACAAADAQLRTGKSFDWQ